MNLTLVLTRPHGSCAITFDAQFNVFVHIAPANDIPDLLVALANSTIPSVRHTRTVYSTKTLSCKGGNLLMQHSKTHLYGNVITCYAYFVNSNASIRHDIHHSPQIINQGVDATFFCLLQNLNRTLDY